MKCVCCDSELALFDNKSYLELPVYFCNNCKSYQTGDSSNITKQKTEELYGKKYWDERSSMVSLESNYTDVDSQGKKRRWLSQYKYCKRFFQTDSRLLEIGAGAGQSLFWFEEQGYEVMGIEPDKRNVIMINKKLKKGKCLEGYAESFESDGLFDVIWISHVFEHILEPKRVLKNLKQKLEKFGVLFIEVPNCENRKVLYDSIYNNPSTFHFSKKGLLNLATKTGFEILCCDYFRSPTLLEGSINRVLKYFSTINPYKYYPKILCNNDEGTDIRLILKANRTEN